jgi:hypothetical protein
LRIRESEKLFSSTIATRVVPWMNEHGFRGIE